MLEAIAENAAKFIGLRRRSSSTVWTVIFLRPAAKYGPSEWGRSEKWTTVTRGSAAGRAVVDREWFTFRIFVAAQSEFPDVRTSTVSGIGPYLPRRCCARVSR